MRLERREIEQWLEPRLLFLTPTLEFIQFEIDSFSMDLSQHKTIEDLAIQSYPSLMF